MALLGLRPVEYFVLTIHRAYNTEDTGKLMNILAACARLPGKVLRPLVVATSMLRP